MIECGAGEKVQVEGRSGTGKTSLFEIMLQFREKESGEISFEQEKKDASPRSVYFTQVPEIFSRGFLYNVCVGNLELVRWMLSRKECVPEDAYKTLFHMVQKSMKDANILHKFEKKRSMLHKLSAGEKQRLQFARLFFSNADVVFLDECFANLDVFNQDLIARKLEAFSERRTLFIISHSKEVLGVLRGKKIVELN